MRRVRPLGYGHEPHGGSADEVLPKLRRGGGRMRVYKCDRCGEYVPRTSRDFFVRKPTREIYKLRKNIHLCSDCAKSFRKWFSECEKEKRE